MSKRIEVLKAENLAKMPSLLHGFFTRKGGISAGAAATLNCGLAKVFPAAEVAENRRRVADQLGVAPAQLLSCQQVHSSRVVTVTEPWALDARPEADAMVTSKPGLALGILTADCVPVLFADITAGVIGAAHAGWRGAVGGVLENTLAAMEALGARKDRIRAAIGPCIWQDSYEVSTEFPKPFYHESPANRRFFKTSAKAGHYMFDLPGYVLAKLEAQGLASVAPSPADTCADEARFFSYRRDTLRGVKEEGGRLISAIVLMG